MTHDSVDLSVDLKVPTLGERTLLSPLRLNEEAGDEIANFVKDDARLLVDAQLENLQRYIDRGDEPPTHEQAGPRSKIYFEPAKTKAAIVTCGGLCPGLNNVIRAIVMQLWHAYGVKSIFGGTLKTKSSLTVIWLV